MNAQTPDPKPLDFAAAVKLALENRNVKPKCLPCGSIGWASLNIGFGVLPTINGGAQLALLVCKKCASVQQFALNDLGLHMKHEERRVLTAGEIAAQQSSKPLIVTG
jgi:hypothetical protein